MIPATGGIGSFNDDVSLVPSVVVTTSARNVKITIISKSENIRGAKNAAKICDQNEATPRLVVAAVEIATRQAARHLANLAFALRPPRHNKHRAAAASKRASTSRAPARRKKTGTRRRNQHARVRQREAAALFFVGFAAAVTVAAARSTALRVRNTTRRATRRATNGGVRFARRDHALARADRRSSRYDSSRRRDSRHRRHRRRRRRRRRRRQLLNHFLHRRSECTRVGMSLQRLAASTRSQMAGRRSLRSN